MISNDPENKDGYLYRSISNDPCSNLSCDSKFGVSFSVKACVKEGYRRGGISSFLGSLLIDWRPLIIDVPTQCEALSIFSGTDAHGPLALDTPCTSRFRGPPCYVECAPFKVEACTVPSALRIATPFDVSYIITNKTSLHHDIIVRVGGTSEHFEGSDNRVGLLLCGFTQGQLSLAPLEEQIFSFTVMATRAGEVGLPALQISSTRHERWVINDGDGGNLKRVFVLP